MAYDQNLGRLPDPTTSPAGPGFVSQAINSISPGMIHQLNSGGSVAVKTAGDYWTISIAYQRLTPSEISTLQPFLYSLQNGFTNFYVQLPTHDNPETGAWTNMPSTGDVSGTQGTKSFSIGNWSAHTTVGEDLSLGDMIKFSNHNKIYMITAKSVNLGTNTATFGLNSEIVSNIDAATIEPNDIKFRVRVVGQLPNLTLTADGLYETFSINLRENII